MVRKKKHTDTLHYRLSPELKARAERLAEKRQTDTTAIAREALLWFIETEEKRLGIKPPKS